MSLVVPPAKSVILWLEQEMETKWTLSKSLSAELFAKYYPRF